MRIDVFLVENGFFPSRSKAAQAIGEGRVLLNGRPVSKAALNVEVDACVTVTQPQTQYVSRAGYKLQEALNVFGVDVRGMTVLDVGASTGGFTDCLLQHGASYVFALDVGTDQLAASLRQDARVRCMEGFNARRLCKADLEFEVGLVTMDVSFISQRLLYPAVASVLPPGGLFISLIKPQFEVGRAHVGKGGIVHDPHGKLIADVLDCLRSAASAAGLRLLRHTPSPILGGDGNREYLALFLRNSYEIN